MQFFSHFRRREKNLLGVCRTPQIDMENDIKIMSSNLLKKMTNKLRRSDSLAQQSF